MSFDVASQTLKCENCGHSITIINDTRAVQEHPLTLASLVFIKPEEKRSRTMQCSGCGAKIEVYEQCTSVACPYCGSQYVLAAKQENGMMPDGVVPFQIDQRQVGEIFRKWMSGRWLAPSSLKTLYQTGKLTGIYLPYWTFDAETRAYYTALGGRTRVERRRDRNGNIQTITHVDWFPTRGLVGQNFDDILVKASNKLDPHLLAKVEPFATNRAASYNPDYFAGYSAECFSRDLSDAHEEAMGVIEKRLYDLAHADVLRRFDQVRNLRIQPQYGRQSFKQLILPVYTTSYHHGSNTYNVIVNGQTGEISGDYPKSWVKIFFIILVVVAVVVVIAMFLV